jgi:hypothetical protein
MNAANSAQKAMYPCRRSYSKYGELLEENSRVKGLNTTLVTKISSLEIIKDYGEQGREQFICGPGAYFVMDACNSHVHPQAS